MRVQARTLTTRNLGQIVSLDGGRTIGELGAVSFSEDHNDVEIVIGGSIIYDLDGDDTVEIYRSLVNAHQVGKDREAELTGRTLMEGDYSEIEKMIYRAVATLYTQQNAPTPALQG